MLRIANSILCLLCAFTAVIGAAEDKTDEPSSTPEKRIVVYYLHNTWRCPGCNSMESMTKAAILGGKGENSKTETSIVVTSPFTEDLATGRLSFETVNIDLKENKPLLEALDNILKIPVVATLDADTIIAVTPLKEAWSYLDDNEAFVKYVQDGAEAVVTTVRPDSADDNAE